MNIALSPVRSNLENFKRKMTNFDFKCYCECCGEEEGGGKCVIRGISKNNIRVIKVRDESGSN